MGWLRAAREPGVLCVGCVCVGVVIGAYGVCVLGVVCVRSFRAADCPLAWATSRFMKVTRLEIAHLAH